MKSVFVKLGTDFLSTIVFLAVYVATDNVIVATLVAIASAIVSLSRNLGEPRTGAVGHLRHSERLRPAGPLS